MRRIHVLEDFDRMGGEIYYREDKERYMRDPELREAFEAGCEHGYRKAMKEFGEDYSERRVYDRDGIIKYRDHDRMNRDWDDDMYDERRRRSARTGRYI